MNVREMNLRGIHTLEDEYSFVHAGVCSQGKHSASF